LYLTHFVDVIFIIIIANYCYLPNYYLTCSCINLIRWYHSHYYFKSTYTTNIINMRLRAFEYYTMSRPALSRVRLYISPYVECTRCHYSLLQTSSNSRTTLGFAIGIMFLLLCFISLSYMNLYYYFVLLELHILY